MALSTPGIGSGLDINGLVSNLMSVERAPINQLNSLKQTANTKLSRLGEIRGALSALQSAAQNLSSRSGFTINRATSSDATSVSALAAAGTSAANYEISVSALASARQVSTGAAFASSNTAVGTGTLRISIGDKNTDISLAAGANSLLDLKNAINTAGAGVTASIVSGSGQARLFITANEAGTAKSFALTNTDGGLSALTSAWTEITPAADAAATINGTPVTSSSNTITSAVDGMTFTALKTTGATPVTVKVEQDRAATKTAIEAFVKAYNDLNSKISSMTSYDPQTRAAGPLNGEGVVRNIQSQLARLISEPVSNGSSAPTRLSEAGVTRQKDGSLAINSTTLEAAIADASKPLSGLFIANSAGDGVAARFNATITSMLGTDGLLSARTDSLNKEIKTTDSRIDAANLRLTAIESRYRKQFNALDSMLASMNSTSSYLTTQFKSLSKTTE